MKKLKKSLAAILITLVLTIAIAISVSAADVGRVTGLKASAVTNNTVALTWNRISAADGYRIQYRENNGTWITLSDTLQTNSYVVKNLKLGSSYTFRVNAYDLVEVKVPILGVISSEKDHANYSTEVSVSNSIGKVTGLKVSWTTSTKVKLSWTKVCAADGYAVYYKVGKCGYKLYGTYDKAQEITINNLQAGKYTFVVRPYIKTSVGKVCGPYTPVEVEVNGLLPCGCEPVCAYCGPNTKTCGCRPHGGPRR